MSVINIIILFFFLLEICMLANICFYYSQGITQQYRNSTPTYEFDEKISEELEAAKKCHKQYLLWKMSESKSFEVSRDTKRKLNILSYLILPQLQE